MKSTLSVVLSTHNEEKHLEGALKSISDIADEIIVVNNESTDNTTKIARKYTKLIYEHKNTPLTLNKPKNYGFSKAKSDWILSLDADERISQKLAQEIKNVLAKKSPAAGYRFPRQNHVFGKWLQHGIWYPDFQIRLFKRQKAKFPAKHNHEELAVDGPVKQLHGHLIHHTYHSITQYIDKFNHTYTDNEAESYLKSGKKISWIDAIRWPLSDFITNFFARQSYKDGLHGLVLSILQAFYSFEVFAKVWEKQGFWEYNSDNLAHDVKQELQAKKQEFSWWYTKELIPWFVKPKEIAKKLLRK